MEISIGSSHSSNAATAGQEAAEQVWQDLHEYPFRLVFVFASSWLDQDAMLSAVNTNLPDSEIIGGSTAGEIGPDGPTSHSCTIFAIGSHKASWSIGYTDQFEHSPFAAGQSVTHQALGGLASQLSSGCLLIGDGMNTRFAEALMGVEKSLGVQQAYCGYLCGDDLRFKKTSQYIQRNVLHDALICLLTRAPLLCRGSLAHGFNPISKPIKVTQSEHNHIQTINGKPAATVLESYFGSGALERIREEGVCRQRLAFPMGTRRNSDQRWTLRNIRELPLDGSIYMNAEVPESSWVHLMSGNQSSLITATEEATRRSMRGVPKPIGMLVFSSYARQRVFGREYAQLEYERIRKIAGHDIPVAGCYSYGEIDNENAQTSLGMEEYCSHTGSILIVTLGTG